MKGRIIATSDTLGFSIVLTSEHSSEKSFIDKFEKEARTGEIWIPSSGGTANEESFQLSIRKPNENQFPKRPTIDSVIIPFKAEGETYTKKEFSKWIWFFIYILMILGETIWYFCFHR